MTKKNKILMLGLSALIALPTILVACGQTTQTTPSIGEQKPLDDSNIYTDSNQKFIENEIKEQISVLEIVFKKISKTIKDIVQFEEKDVNKNAMTKLSEEYLKISENFQEGANLKNKIDALDNTKNNYIESLGEIESKLSDIQNLLFAYSKDYFEKTQNKSFSDSEVFEDLKDFHLMSVILNSLTGNTDIKWLPIDLSNLSVNSNKEITQKVQEKMTKDLLQVATTLPKNEVVKLINLPIAILFQSIVSVQQNIAIAKMMHQKVSNEKMFVAINKVSQLYPERITNFNFADSFVDQVNKLETKITKFESDINEIIAKVNDPEMNFSQNVKNIFTKVQSNMLKISQTFKGSNDLESTTNFKEIFYKVKKVAAEMPKNKITTITEFNQAYQKIKLLNNEIDSLNYINYLFAKQFQDFSLETIEITNVIAELSDEKYDEFKAKISNLLPDVQSFFVDWIVLFNSHDKDSLSKFSHSVVLSRSLFKMILIQAALDNVDGLKLEKLDWR